MDAAIRLYHKKECDQILAVLNGEEADLVGPDRLWFWSVNRWKDFIEREYELRPK